MKYIKFDDLTKEEQAKIKEALADAAKQVKSIYARGFKNGLFVGTLVALGIFFMVQLV